MNKYDLGYLKEQDCSDDEIEIVEWTETIAEGATEEEADKIIKSDSTGKTIEQYDPNGVTSRYYKNGQQL